MNQRLRAALMCFVTTCFSGIALLGLVSYSDAQVNHAPVVKNVRAQQRSGTRLIDITYDVEDEDGDLLEIIVEASDDDGQTYSIIPESVTGAFGKNIVPGSSKLIVWDVGQDLPGAKGDDFKVRVIADDGMELTPDIRVSASSLDFGEVVVDVASEQTFNIHNDGDGALQIFSITSNNNQFSVLAYTDVEPGGMVTVTVRFAPSSSGAITGVVTITSNDPNEPVKTVSVQGNVVELTYAVEDVTRARGATVEFTDSSLKEYKLIIDSNALSHDGKVVLGFSGSEPDNIPNPEVHLLEAIGVGFEGRSLDGPLEVVMPQPTGVTSDTDAESIMTFIYDGEDYRFVDRYIAQTLTTITVIIDPEYVADFSVPNHKFDRTLSQTLDTVFYVLITRFDEPVISPLSVGIHDPRSPLSQVNIGADARRIALIVHGITSESDDFSYLISSLRDMTDNSGQTYYDYVLTFNYYPGQPIESSRDLLMSQLQDVILAKSSGEIDVIAHGTGGLVVRGVIVTEEMPAVLPEDEYTIEWQDLNGNGIWDPGEPFRIIGLPEDMDTPGEMIGTPGETTVVPIRSLTMLGTPHGGVGESLLRNAFADFLRKTSSDPAWTYYREGWQGTLEGASFLSNLNNQSGKTVDTHYYGIVVAWDTDGLASLGSADFTDNNRFPLLEQPLTETLHGIEVTPPSSEGRGFMSGTRHVAMIKSPDVINRITEYLLDQSEDIVNDDMVLIPAGEFQMGDSFDEGHSSELPVHTVYLDAFHIDRYEVTNSQYAAFLNSYGKNTDDSGNVLLDIGGSGCLIEQSGGSYVAKPGYEEHPVIEVSWYGAKAYAEYYGKRLPTEAQWEKAARGELVGERYPWGDDISHDNANYGGTGGKDIWSGTSPVGSFSSNGYRLYDMAGNAWEWCADWLDEDYYSSSPRNNPVGPSSGDFRVVRGGSWYYGFDEYVLRCACRNAHFFPTFTFDYIGFRCSK